MTDDRPPFAPRGRISAQDACEQIIAAIPQKEGVTFAQACDDVADLCGHRHTRATVVSAMLAASEALLKRGELGVVPARAGWVRMDDAAAVEYARDHARRAARQVVKSATGAAAADPEALSWEDRQSRDHFIRARDRAREITERRGRRLRPLPSAG